LIGLVSHGDRLSGLVDSESNIGSNYKPKNFAPIRPGIGADLAFVGASFNVVPARARLLPFRGPQKAPIVAPR